MVRNFIRGMVSHILYTVFQPDVLCAGFPNAAVIDAYMNPTVDDSMESFSWAAPDIENLREYPFTLLCLLLVTVNEL